MFWKKKKPIGKLSFGVDLKRCAECHANIRPCLADGKPAVFHRWVEDDQSLLKINIFVREKEQARLYQDYKNRGFVPTGCSVEVLRAVSALVEYPDGSTGKVKPELIQFLDRKEDHNG